MLISGLVFNIAGFTVYYRLRTGRCLRYRGLILISLVGVATALGFVPGGLDVPGVLLRVVPWAAIVALLASS